MPDQADDLPGDMEQLAALVRELQAKNAQLRALLKGMAHQAFGSRSERASVILGEQGLLDLGDLVATPAAAANDDGDAEDKPAVARPRRKRGLPAMPGGRRSGASTTPGDPGLDGHYLDAILDGDGALRLVDPAQSVVADARRPGRHP